MADKLEITVERGLTSEWGQQQTAVFIGNVQVKDLWLPAHWSDAQVAAYLLFGTYIPFAKGEQTRENDEQPD